MTRRIVAAVALATFSLASMGAHALSLSDNTEKNVVGVIDEERKEIKYEDLPEKVKLAFEQSRYAEWTVSEVYEVQTESEKEFELAISTTDGSLPGVLSFDTEGNIIVD